MLQRMAKCGQSPNSQYVENGQHWSLLRLNPQKQRNYVSLLQEYLPGVESYYPIYSKMSRANGHRRAVKVERPVYPGYIFLLVQNDMSGPVNLPVSARWVRFGGHVESIPDFVIQRLRYLESHNELVKEVKYVNPYYPGAKVRVVLPVADLAAVIVRLVGRDRAVVDTDLCRVTVPVHRLRVV
jgi:transcription antitermination factor NusG